MKNSFDALPNQRIALLRGVAQQVARKLEQEIKGRPIKSVNIKLNVGKKGYKHVVLTIDVVVVVIMPNVKASRKQDTLRFFDKQDVIERLVETLVQLEVSWGNTSWLIGEPVKTKNVLNTHTTIVISGRWNWSKRPKKLA